MQEDWDSYLRFILSRRGTGERDTERERESEREREREKREERRREKREEEEGSPKYLNCCYPD